MIYGNILKRNGYAVSTQTISYFVVYSCVAVTLACMSKTLYFPVTVVCAYDLGVARDDVEGYFCLGTVELHYANLTYTSKRGGRQPGPIHRAIWTTHIFVHNNIFCEQVNL